MIKVICYLNNVVVFDLILIFYFFGIIKLGVRVG